MRNYNVSSRSVKRKIRRIIMENAMQGSYDLVAAVQSIVDGNQFLRGKIVSESDLIETSEYVVWLSDDSIDHIKLRHMDPSAPGSLFDPSVDLRRAVSNLVNQSPTSTDGGRVKWLGIDAGMRVGEMGVAWAPPEEVASMQDYTMKDGRRETVKIAPGEREPTSELSLITTVLGEHDGRQVLSVITMFPGGESLDGRIIPMDRNTFAEQGFYFPIPTLGRGLAMESVARRWQVLAGIRR